MANSLSPIFNQLPAAEFIIPKYKSIMYSVLSASQIARQQHNAIKKATPHSIAEKRRNNQISKYLSSTPYDRGVSGYGCGRAVISCAL